MKEKNERTKRREKKKKKDRTKHDKHKEDDRNKPDNFFCRQGWASEKKRKSQLNVWFRL